MSAVCRPAAGIFLSLFLAATAVSAQATAAPGMSRVRIVRLSEVMGAVETDRGVNRGFETAIDNLPIVESSRIRTGRGVAEVEFEDNSTLRLGTDSEVDFPELERTASGTPVTEVRVVRGMAYVSLVKDRNSDFTLIFGPTKQPDALRLSPQSHVRLQVTETEAQLAVLGGTVQVSGPDGLITVPRKRTVSFLFARMNQPAVRKDVAAESLDAWDRQSANYHADVATLSAFGNAPASYGVNDMAYYGAFSDAGGCGNMWRPYFAGAGWNPYANGVWAWYGNTAGYSWVSPYPWGWMPYHYGAWSYCQGSGWGWMPGGAWNGLSNVPATTKRIASRISGTPRPLVGPPAAGRPTLIVVMTRPFVASNINEKGSFVFRQGSAGLGIPREGLGKLRGFSRAALRRGTASTRVYLTVDANQGRLGGRTAAADQQLAPVMIHRGFAPDAMLFDSGYHSSAFNGDPVNLPDGNPSAPVSAMSSGPAIGAGGAHGVGGAPAGGGGGHPR